MVTNMVMTAATRAVPSAPCAHKQYNKSRQKPGFICIIPHRELAVGAHTPVRPYIRGQV